VDSSFLIVLYVASLCVLLLVVDYVAGAFV
jgi:hypothetical protein